MGLYIVLGILIVSVVLLVIAAFSSASRTWRLRSPLQRIKPTRKRKSKTTVKKKQKRMPVVQVTFNKR